MKKILVRITVVASGAYLAAASPCAAEDNVRLIRAAANVESRLVVGDPATADHDVSAVSILRLPPCEPKTPSQSRLLDGLNRDPAMEKSLRPASFVAAANAASSGESVPAAHAAVLNNLSEALETALERNPALVALRQAEPVSRAALGVARTYPFNPYVQLQALPFSRERTGGTTPVSHYVLLMQTLELAHQSRYRDAAGVASLTFTQWNIHQAELTNIAMTERMFFAALYQRGVRNLTISLARLNEDLVGVLQRRFSAGTALTSDVALARLQAHAARQQANLAITGYSTALLDLRTQLGLFPDEPFEPQGDLVHLNWQPAHAALSAEGAGNGEVAELASGRPDVMAARADVVLSRANANLARANRVPNVQIGPYYSRDDFATTFWGFRSQVDIPVINNGLPLLRQRMAELRQREIALEQLQTRAQLEAIAAIDRYERARKLIDKSQSQFSQDLAEDVRRVETQFQAGQADLLRVYAARTGLIQTERALLDTLNELAQAASRVTETTGLPPHSLVRSMP